MRDRYHVFLYRRAKRCEDANMSQTYRSLYFKMFYFFIRQLLFVIKHGCTFVSLKVSKKEVDGSTQVVFIFKKSVGKVMCIKFFSCHGIKLNNSLPEDTAVNGEYYAQVVKLFLTKVICKKERNLCIRRGYICSMMMRPCIRLRFFKTP